MPWRRFSTKKRRGQTTTRRKSSTVSKKVKRYVKKQLDKAIEDKMYMSDLLGFQTGDNSLILTPSSSTLPLYFSLIPSISQGDGLQQRTGTKIKLIKSTLDIQCVLSGAAVTSGVDVPVNLYYFVLQARDSPDSLSSGDLNNLFYYTGGTTQFLSGSGWASTHHINNDYFNVIKTNYPSKPIKLGYAAYSSNLYTNNDYKSSVHFKLDLTKKVAKLLRFNNTASTCMNHNWYFCWYVQKQNLNTTVTDWDPPQIYVSQTIRYEDA